MTDIYETAYRMANPKMTTCPFERQPELRDLYPSLQRDFRKAVDAAVASQLDTRED